jgi:hypothetical protein
LFLKSIRQNTIRQHLTFHSNNLSTPLAMKNRYQPIKKQTAGFLHTATALLLGFLWSITAGAQSIPPPPPPPAPSASCGPSEPSETYLFWKKGDRWLKGIVTDAEGQPMVSTNIVVNLIASASPKLICGTVSDRDGSFALTVPKEGCQLEIVFSSIGYETLKIPLGAARTPLNVELQTAAYELTTVEVISFRLRQELHINIDISPVSAAADAANAPTELIAFEKVYPNPFTSELNIELTLPEPDRLLFQLFDVAGKSVLTEARSLQEGAQLVRLELGGLRLPAGAYVLRISGQAGEIRTRPVIRQ